MLIKAIFTNSFGILISRVLGFVRDLLTASILGANIYSDIFFVAFKLPNLFRRIFGEGAFTQAFIPSYASSNHKVLFSAGILNRFLLIIFIISLIVTLFAPLITKVVAFGFDAQTVDIAAPFFAINFYYLDLIFLVTLFGSLLQYKNHFATTAFSTALLNLSLIGALLIAQEMEKIVIVEYLSWGVIIGGFLQVITHIMALKKYNLLYLFSALTRAKTKVKDDISKFNKQFVPAVFGSSTAHISAFLDTWLASFLVSGSISYLYYANRILQLPLALFAIATSVALFPMIAKSIKNGDETRALKLLKKSFWILSLLLGSATLIGMVFAQEIIWLLFERGEFSAQDTINSSSVLWMYMIGLFPFGIAKIFSLWLYAHHKQLRAAKISAISLGFNIIFSLIFMKLMGVDGLALASSLSGVILLFLTLKEFGFAKFFILIKF